MTKRKYLRELRKALTGVSERDKDKLIEYYDEMIDESRERGKTDREIFAELGTPKQVASDYFNANEGELDYYDDELSRPRGRVHREGGGYEREPRVRKGRRVVQGHPLLTVLLFPVWFPLAIAAFVIALALFLIGIVLIIALAVSVVAFGAAGLYSIGISFGIIGANGGIAMAQIGAGIAFLGLSVLAALLVKPAGKGFGSMIGWVGRGFRRSERVAAARSSKTIFVAAVGIALVLAGGGLGALGMGKLQWKWTNLAVVGEVSEVSESVSLAEVSCLSLESDDITVTVQPTEGEARLVFTDLSKLPKAYSYEDGKISLQTRNWTKGVWSYMKGSWRYGIAYRSVYSHYSRAVLYLPADYCGEFRILLQNGAINLKEISLGQVTAIAQNGAVRVTKGKFSAFSATADNGSVVLEDVSSEKLSAGVANGNVSMRNVISQNVEAKVDNGAILLNRVLSDELTLNAGNGAINGSLMGNSEEYSITAGTGVGKCNLNNSEQGIRKLNVYAGFGDISISFEQE